MLDHFAARGFFGDSPGDLKRCSLPEATGRFVSDGLSPARILDHGGALRDVLVRRWTSPAPLARRQRLSDANDFSVRVHELVGGYLPTWTEQRERLCRVGGPRARVFYPSYSRYSTYHRPLQAVFRGAVS